MDVYKVTPASYSAPVARDREAFLSRVGVGAFTAGPMHAHWPDPVMEPTESAMLASDFFYFGLGGLAFPVRTLEVFQDLFERVGEILPFTMSGTTFFVLNVLRRVEGLDREQSDVRRLANGKIVKIARYAFDPAAVAHEILFQIPEEAGVLFTVSGASGPMKDFYKTYSECAMAGLKFDRVWSQRVAR